MTLRYVEDDGFQGEWSRLTCAQSPLADAVWIRKSVDAFAATGQRPTIHTVHHDSRLIAGIPLWLQDDRIVRAWTSFDNEHHPYWLVSGALEVPAAECLLQHLLEAADYVYLRRLPMHDPSSISLVTAARRLGLPVAQVVSESGDARIVLDRPWEALRARFPKHLQRDMLRSRRHLEKLGRLDYAEHTAPGPRLDALLAECFDVEARSWKGTEGAPIKHDPRTLRFYTQLAREMAATNRFVLYTLTLADRIIAFQYSLRGGGHLEGLKISFDPAFAAQSPAKLLRMLLI